MHVDGIEGLRCCNACCLSYSELPVAVSSAFRFFSSLSFCRGSRVEGSMSRARVPCRGSRVTFFFPIFFFLEKVIIDAINVMKANKKNLKNKWRVNIF